MCVRESERERMRGEMRTLIKRALHSTVMMVQITPVTWRPDSPKGTSTGWTERKVMPTCESGKGSERD